MSSAHCNQTALLYACDSRTVATRSSLHSTSSGQGGTIQNADWSIAWWAFLTFFLKQPPDRLALHVTILSYKYWTPAVNTCNLGTKITIFHISVQVMQTQVLIGGRYHLASPLPSNKNGFERVPHLIEDVSWKALQTAFGHGIRSRCWCW